MIDVFARYDTETLYASEVHRLVDQAIQNSESRRDFLTSSGTINKVLSQLVDQGVLYRREESALERLDRSVAYRQAEKSFGAKTPARVYSSDPAIPERDEGTTAQFLQHPEPRHHGPSRKDQQRAMRDAKRAQRDKEARDTAAAKRPPKLQPQVQVPATNSAKSATRQLTAHELLTQLAALLNGPRITASELERLQRENQELRSQLEGIRSALRAVNGV
jgi:hypothetical protein